MHRTEGSQWHSAFRDESGIKLHCSQYQWDSSTFYSEQGWDSKMLSPACCINVRRLKVPLPGSIIKPALSICQSHTKRRRNGSIYAADHSPSNIQGNCALYTDSPHHYVSLWLACQVLASMSYSTRLIEHQPTLLSPCIAQCIESLY